MLMNGEVEKYKPRFQLQPDVSVIDAVRKGMLAHPKKTDAAALVAGINPRAYRLIRKLLILSEQNLPLDDKDAIKHALTIIEHTRGVGGQVEKLLQDVMERNWLKRKENPHAIKQRMRRFDKTILHIQESCESSAELRIPRELASADVIHAIASLSASIEMIGRLMRRLAGETLEDKETGK